MQYKKCMDMKIVRTRHEITIFIRSSAGSLRKCLYNIPDDAILIDESVDDNQNTILIFEKEQIEQPFKLSEKETL